MLIDRMPDFYRARSTRCAGCGHEEKFDQSWLTRWEQGYETCPECGADCSDERATRIVADPDDPALQLDEVCGLSWWHSSTLADWPSATYDPLAGVTNDALTRFAEDVCIASWANGKKERALHVGTYEAAVHNMLRRIDDEWDGGKQFFLSRVHLRPDLVINGQVTDDLSEFGGDLPLRTACPPGIDATRYVNQHEDPGSISLALGRGAIQYVQRIPIPVKPQSVPPWYEQALGRLVRASPELVVIDEPDSFLAQLRQRTGRTQMTSERARVQAALLDEIAAYLPESVSVQVRAAIELSDNQKPSDWCDYLAGMMQLIDEPQLVIETARQASREHVR